MAYNKIGTTGGEGGLAFDNYQVPEGARLREIRLLCDQYVNALQLIYTDADGNIGELRPVGGLSGQLQVFTLEDGEYLTGISGRSGWYIDSLKFNTNKRSSETYGGTGGETYFQIDAPKNTELAGFYGRADWHLDQLGAIVRDLPKGSAAKKSTKEAAPAKAAPAKKVASAKKAAAPKKKAPKKVDLTIIEGIGPKLASILQDSGINDLAVLAKTEVNNLKNIIEKAGRRFNLADPTTWPEQAALAAKEAWEELEKLQDKLKGGRRN